jgi:hypothetical protein
VREQGVGERHDSMERGAASVKRAAATSPASPPAPAEGTLKRQRRRSSPILVEWVGPGQRPDTVADALILLLGGNELLDILDSDGDPAAVERAKRRP